MTNVLAGLFAAALVIGLASTPTLTYAEEDTTEEAGNGSDSAEGSAKDETFLEKLEEDFKETTTPTDEETDPIGTAEDIDRDLY